MEFDSKKLDIGSRVLVTSLWYGKKTERLGTVVKITPSGLIDVRTSGSQPVRYRRNGTQYAREPLYSGGRAYLSIPTSEDIERVEIEERRKALVRQMGSTDWNKYSLEKLLKICKILKEDCVNETDGCSTPR